MGKVIPIVGRGFTDGKTGANLVTNLTLATNTSNTFRFPLYCDSFSGEDSSAFCMI